MNTSPLHWPRLGRPLLWLALGLLALSLARGLVGDVIAGVAGKPIDGAGPLLGRLDDYRVGERGVLQVRRGERVIDVPATLQAGN